MLIPFRNLNLLLTSDKVSGEVQFFHCLKKKKEGGGEEEKLHNFYIFTCSDCKNSYKCGTYKTFLLDTQSLFKSYRVTRNWSIEISFTI